MITTASLATGVIGQPYSQTLQGTGGTPPYTWGLGAGSGPLPAGLTLSAAGVISGTPTAVASVDIIVQVRDSGGRVAPKTLPIFVADVLRVTTASLFDGNVGIFYLEFLSATGGFGGDTWTIVLGALPAGITMNSSGQLIGTPTASGTFNFTVQVTDQGSPPQTASQALSLFIGNKLVLNTPKPLPLAVLTRSYSVALQAFGGATPYTWSIAQGALPAGLSLDPASGMISGTPTQSGSFFGFIAQVTDSSSPPQTATQLLSLSVNPVLSIPADTLPDGVLMAGYPGGVSVVGGIPPYIGAITAGALPPGLSIPPQAFSSGIPISGAPTQLGTFSFTLQVSDSESPPMTSSKMLTIRVNPLLVFQAPSSLPVGLQGQPYSFTFSASGGLPPYQWSVIQTPLPAGLTLDAASGVLSGTPAAAFNSNLLVQVGDSTNPPQQALQSLPLRIAGVLTVTTSALPRAMVNSSPSMQLGLSGGTGPFTWSIFSGALPAGLTLNSTTGTITGTVTMAGTSTFTLQVNDAGPPIQTAKQPLSFTVASSLGRNDAPATATPLSNGTYDASISPYADPVAGPVNPDMDVYQIASNPGAVVTIETFADRLNPRSPLDTVIEIVDAAGVRLSICSPPFAPSGPFNQPCLNDDDFVDATTDSKLFLQVPPAATTPMTFFVRVLDFRGDARPDFRYRISVTGAN